MKYVERVETPLLVWCFPHDNGRPIEETEALKLNNILNKVRIIERHDSSLVAKAKLVINFSAAFIKVYGVSFHGAGW